MRSDSVRRVLLCAAAAVIASGTAAAQKPLSWEEVRERFRRNNPNLLAGQTFVEETKANQVTAGLRPNPILNIAEEQFEIYHPAPLQPFQNTQLTHSLSFLWERRNKRELRVESAAWATRQATTDNAELERQLTFQLRDAFIRTLQAKSILELARENMAYYGRVVAVNRERYKAGDIARSDLDRVELQQAQFETDLVNAGVNVRTAKIGMLALMNEHEPLDAFDIHGVFDFTETVLLKDELRRMALESRPDLQSAAAAVSKAESDNRLAWANGSWDPQIGFEYQRTQPNNTAGLLLTVPIRIWDRNQGEKARTQLEIRRAQQLRDGLTAAALRDVDSAYEQLESVRQLLRPYRDRYLPQAASVRETVSFAYQRGGASLLDFLDAQKSYRDTQLTYRNLIAAYLSAANQLNMAVGREVIP